MFLRKSLEIEPKNAKARQLLVQLKKKKRDQKALEKKLPALIAAVVPVIIAILIHMYIGKPNYAFDNSSNDIETE
ncbi:hypothetical protein PR001_g24233 [Phytophthora rubi]|uniref:Uncharacterized protein n=1 Tax=Phytophthora rubi TaxID=129364 RepID=A0A6A3IKI0_9STRA|nr:hypothetical protein PR001_g24233 [Phytophthora rubi]